MDIVNILNIALSFMFVFLILSMMTSIFQEFVAGYWNSRGQILKKAIQNMFDDPAFAGLAQRFYKHPLIAGLIDSGASFPKFTWMRFLLPFVVPRVPSYIPKETFADAICDILRQNGSFTSEMMQPALNSLWELAEKDQAAFREKLMDWYTTVGERAKGTYVRGTQRKLFVYGLLLAIALNVDTLTIATSLWTAGNVSRSAEIASRTAEFYGAQQNADSAGQKTYAQLLNTLTSLKLPMGWSDLQRCRAAKALPPAMQTGMVADWIMGVPDKTLCLNVTTDSTPWSRLLGWILTALATSLGAQFWFDTLGKLVNVRAAGTKPTAPES